MESFRSRIRAEDGPQFLTLHLTRLCCQRGWRPYYWVPPNHGPQWLYVRPSDTPPHFCSSLLEVDKCFRLGQQGRISIVIRSASAPDGSAEDGAALRVLSLASRVWLKGGGNGVVHGSGVILVSTWAGQTDVLRGPLPCPLGLRGRTKRQREPVTGTRRRCFRNFQN